MRPIFLCILSCVVRVEFNCTFDSSKGQIMMIAFFCSSKGPLAHLMIHDT